VSSRTEISPQTEIIMLTRNNNVNEPKKRTEITNNITN
jgi:hypothetical protein